MAYQKTEWLPYETLVSAGNLNKIEDQLQTVTTTVELNEMTLKSTEAKVGKLAEDIESNVEATNKISVQVAEISSEVTSVKEAVAAIESEKNLSMIKSNKDSEGVYTVVTYKRKADNTIYCVSTLSGGTSPLYTTRTEQYYDVTGTSVVATHVYTLSYDDDGNLISEV